MSKNRVQNKDGSGTWPGPKHIGWSVAAAGPIDLDIEYVARSYIPFRDIPTGTKFILKDIDEYGYAWIYRDDYGVVRLPKELLVAWDR